MSRLRHGQDGFTLPEVLVAMAISIIVLGAVLSVFETFIRQTRRVDLRSQAQDTARIIVDDITRNLRNEAQRRGTSVTVERSLGNDLITRAFDPFAPNTNPDGLRRVRYCLDTTNPAAERLIRQTQTWSGASLPAMPSDTACPGAGWTSTTAMATTVTNMRTGMNRPLFTYYSVTDGAVTTTTGIDFNLWISIDPNSATSEVNLLTGIVLRNANRPPTASFTVTKQNGTVILNAAPSIDPEGDPLRYSWTVGGSFAGSSARLETTLTATTTVTLTVTDTGDLQATQTQSVSP